MKRPVGIVVAALLVAGCGAVSPSKLAATPLISVPSVMPGSPDPVSPASSATLPQGNPTETMVDVGGRSLSVSCAGESTPGEPTVVFEHGLEGRATDWSPIQSALSETVKACAYDRAGLGRSDAADHEPRTVRDLADDLEKLLDRAGIQPPYVFVSHSLGPWVTTLFTVEHPDSVVGLVFVDPRGPDVGAGWLAALPAAMDGEAEALTYARIAMTSSWPDPSANREALDLPASETEVRAALATVTPPFGDIPLVVLQAEIPLDFVADLPEPARSAFRDAWVDGQEALASDSTAGRIEFVPDSTHDVPGDAPASVIEAILEVLAAAQ